MPRSTCPGSCCTAPGWPLDHATYGGGFMYHAANRQVSVGLVVGLGYTNPYLDPFQEFQRYKTHPAIAAFLEGGKRIAYGARAINASGLQSLPKLVFPGGALVGCDAGFLNAPRIKGSHAAIKSGMLAGDAAFAALAAGRGRDELAAYPAAFASSWLHDELHRARNFKPYLDRGLVTGARPVGHRPDRPARPRSVDAAQAAGGPREAVAGGALRANRVPEARRRAHVRQVVVGLSVEHEPRGGPARPPAAARPDDSGRGQSRAALRDPSSDTAPPASTNSSTTSVRMAEPLQQRTSAPR